MSWTACSRWFAATVLFGAAALGCGATSTGPPPATAANAADDDVADALTEHHRHHHHGGVTLLIAMSLDTLGVSSEQQAAVEKIRTDLHARMAPARVAEENFMVALADGVAAGNVDAAAADGNAAKVAAAAASIHEASADALNELHAVLTPPQRAALVDKVEAHWGVWQRANSDAGAAPTAGGNPLAALSEDLGLTADQVEKIRSGFDEKTKAAPPLDPRAVEAHLRAFGDAFRGEKFDARAISSAGDANTRMVGWSAARTAHFVEAVSAVLTPDQRAEFARRLREHATHDPSAQATP